MPETYAQKHRRLGLCIECPSKAIKDRVRCQKCADKVKAHRERVVQKGICGICRKRKAVRGLRSCRKCRKKSNARVEADRLRQRSLGLCARIGCDQEPAEGKTQCEEHLRYTAASTKRTQEKWRKNGLCWQCGKRKAGTSYDGRRILLCRKCRPLDPLNNPAILIAQRKREGRELKKNIEILSGRHRRVIEMRYGLTGQTPMSWSEIAKVEGVTGEAIRQAATKALCAIEIQVPIRKGPKSPKLRIQDSRSL